MDDQQRHFAAVFDATYADLVRFAARRVPRHQAEDVAADAFTVAWRRHTDLPTDPDQARAWLFGITRRLLLARHSHGQHLPTVALVTDPPVPGHEDTVVAATDLAAAWNRLSPAHQDALALTVWDGLSGAQAATVLGITPLAYRLRLSRARAALRAHLLPRATTRPRISPPEGSRP